MNRRTTAVPITALLLLLSGQLLAAPGEDALTVERIYSDPPLGGRLPGQVKFSPDGSTVTFLRPRRDSEGPSLWRHDVASGERTVRVRATDLPSGDDGEALRISAYHWSPTGKDLVLEAGGDLFSVPNRRWTISWGDSSFRISSPAWRT